MRRAWIRKTAPAGAIWTIEQGAAPGALHLNILHEEGLTANAGQAATWSQPINTSPRIVAAYISKRRSIPDRELNNGKNYGRCGHIWEYLLENRDAPIVQAAAIERALTTEPPRIPGDPVPKIIESMRWGGRKDPEPEPEISREDAKKIAEAWLPNIRKIMRQSAA